MSGRSIAVLCMLIKPDKPPSQTTSYRPISLLGAIMKLFERVIGKRLRKHLEDNGFFSKYQSGFRKSKSTNDHLLRLSQTIMESFSRGEHVIAAFLDVEKAFDNVWHNGLRYKIYQLDLPTKLCRWLSDFLVGRVIQVKIEGFLPPKVIIFTKSRSAITAEPALSLYGDLLSYYPHIKFLGITFDKTMTFTKHFEKILECCNQKFHRLRILVNKKWGPSPETILQIYKQCVRPIFECGIVSTIILFGNGPSAKIQRVQNSFIRVALRLP